MQARQPRHLSASMRTGKPCLTYLSSAQGRRETITEGASLASSSRSTRVISAMSLGSTTRMFSAGTPAPSQSFSMCIFGAGTFLSVMPVVGFCWWPVMPVMALSSTIIVVTPRL